MMGAEGFSQGRESEPPVVNLDDLLSDLPGGDETNTPMSHSHQAPSGASRKIRSPITYRYPVAGLGLGTQIVDRAALLHRLEELCGQRDMSGGLVSYSQIRVEVCQINLTMSKENTRPPAYRPARKYPRGGRPTLERVAVSGDAKMHDLLWLYFAAGFRRPLEDKRFRNLMSKADFDLEMAEEFVGQSWRTEVRVRDIMVLSDVEQWQLAALLSQEVREYRDELRRASYRVNARLRTYSQRTGKLKADVDDLTALWKADQMCGGKNQGLIAQVHAWDRGHAPLKVPTISAKLKLLRSVLTKC